MHIKSTFNFPQSISSSSEHKNSNLPSPRNHSGCVLNVSRALPFTTQFTVFSFSSKWVPIFPPTVWFNYAIFVLSIFLCANRKRRNLCKSRAPLSLYSQRGKKDCMRAFHFIIIPNNKKELSCFFVFFYKSLRNSSTAQHILLYHFSMMF